MQSVSLGYDYPIISLDAQMFPSNLYICGLYFDEANNLDFSHHHNIMARLQF